MTISLSIDPSTPTTLYAGTTIGIYKSVNGGSNWSRINSSFRVQVLIIDPTTPTTLYAGAINGVFKSTDGGSNWVAAGLTGANIRALAIDPVMPSTLYAGTGGGVDSFIVKIANQ
jgi:photosystem II stability/assembly factor-like uncharacterized protein